MRIVVNDIAASKTGALSILKDFYSYIQENDTEKEWILLLSDSYLEETDRISIRLIPDVKKGWLHRLKFDLFDGKKVLKELHPDVFFSMQNTLVKGWRGYKALYVHQPLGYQKTKRFSFLKKQEREYAVYQHLIGRLIDSSVKKADVTIVQTEWMRKAVLEKTKADPAKVVKILPTISDIEPGSENADPAGNVFFYPSGNISYKNHSLLYKAAALLLAKGITDFQIRVTLTKEELLGHLKDPKEDVLECFACLGRIEREEVLKEYRQGVLVFPSYIETFGYPPAEASAAGTIVLASDCPFCHEVLADYPNGYYFDPFDAKALAELMERVIKGKITCKPVAKKDHKEHTERNSWAEVVQLLLKGKT